MEQELRHAVKSYEQLNDPHNPVNLKFFQVFVCLLKAVHPSLTVLFLHKNSHLIIFFAENHSSRAAFHQGMAHHYET